MRVSLWIFVLRDDQMILAADGSHITAGNVTEGTMLVGEDGAPRRVVCYS